ncbi:TrmB family transcriptional regulator [Candidatus Acetothermia bacterium]|nr:TrmB family transcriptional regulator [Candidatus Acetothermia bacterium]
MSQDAVQSLEALGLMRYEAELFVALTKLEQGTATDISRVSQIPRSRVEKLKRRHERGLQEASQQLQKVQRERTLKRARSGEFWIINGLENVTARAEEMLQRAHRSVLIAVLLPRLVSEEMLELLRKKSKKNVEIIVASSDQSLLSQLQKAVPSAKAILIPPYSSEAGVPGRLVIIDREELLLSTLGEEELPGIPHESAIWSDAPGFAATVGLFVEMAAKALRSK